MPERNLSNAQKRNHADAMRAAKLAAAKVTHKEIAKVLDIPVRSVRAWIDLGQRLIDEQDGATT